MADEPENLVLELLRRVAADQAAVKADIAAMKAEQRTQGRTVGIMLQDIRLLRAAVNDIAKENVTPGEMEAVHHDLTKLRLEIDGLTTRLETVEEHIKEH